MKFLFLFANLFALSASAGEEGQFALGVQGGNVALFEDVSGFGNNGLALGAYGGFYISEELLFNAGYLQSKNEDVNHHEITLGIDVFLADYNSMLPFVSAGVSFLGNSIKNDTHNVDVSGDAFGLYLGGGVDFSINPHLVAGVQARYHFAFESETTLASGEKVKTVQDSASVIVRLAYLFGGSN